MVEGILSGVSWSWWMVDGAGGAVHQLGGSVRDRDRLEEGLGLRDDGGLVSVQAPDTKLGRGYHDRPDVLKVVILAAVSDDGVVSVHHGHHHRLHDNYLRR